MQIVWKGQSCFQIISQSGKNSQVYLVIDPFDETIGLRVPKLEADILLISHSHFDHNNKKAVSSPVPGQIPFIIEGAGEYEIKGVFIQGIHSLGAAKPSLAGDETTSQRPWHDEKEGKDYNPPTSSSHPDNSGRAPRGENTIYTIESEDLRLCHLGDFGQKELSDEQLEKIGDIDILMVPVGGIYTIDPKGAAKIISQIEPKIVIPMHYQIPERQRRVEMKRQLHQLPKLKMKLEGIDRFLKAMGAKTIEPQNKLSIKKKDLPEEGLKIIVLKI